MRSMALCLAASGLFVGTCLVAGYLFLALVFWEPDAVGRRSLAYFIAIPAEAKNFPLWAACDEPKFSYRIQDGLSPEIYWISYTSRLANDELKSAFRRHARTRGCSSLPIGGSFDYDSRSKKNASCRTETHEITMSVTAVSGRQQACVNVSIEFTARSL